MVSGPPPKLKFTKVLQDALAAVTTKPCGLGTPPKADGQPVVPPYTILTNMPGDGLYALSMSGRFDEAEFSFQATFVSAKDDRQALWMQDKAHQLFERDADGEYVVPLALEGWTVKTRQYDEDAGRDSEGVIVSLVERYTFCLTPN